MAYGNYAPFYRGGYFNPTPTIPQMADTQTQYLPQIPNQLAPTNDMIFVLNRNEADSFPVAPNNSVVLWDKSNPTIYVKSVSQQGVPSMRVLDFVERTADNSPTTHECKCGGKYVAIEEFNEFKAKFDELSAKVDGMKPKTKKAEAE
jgi:hypothetical protein